MLIYEKLKELSKRFLVTGDPLRASIQMVISDIQGEAKSSNTNITDATCLLIFKRTVKRLVESSAITPLSENDDKLRILLLSMTPSTLNLDDTRTLLDSIKDKLSPNSFRGYMDALDEELQSKGCLVDKKMAVEYIKELLK